MTSNSLISPFVRQAREKYAWFFMLSLTLLLLSLFSLAFHWHNLFSTVEKPPSWFIFAALVLGFGLSLFSLRQGFFHFRSCPLDHWAFTLVLGLCFTALFCIGTWGVKQMPQLQAANNVLNSNMELSSPPQASERPGGKLMDIIWKLVSDIRGFLTDITTVFLSYFRMLFILSSIAIFSIFLIFFFILSLFCNQRKAQLVSILGLFIALSFSGFSADSGATYHLLFGVSFFWLAIILGTNWNFVDYRIDLTDFPPEGAQWLINQERSRDLAIAISSFPDGQQLLAKLNNGLSGAVEYKDGKPVRIRESIKKRFSFWNLIVFCFSLLYLFNPGWGCIEVIPDNIPFFGNLDELLFALIAFNLYPKLREDIDWDNRKSLMDSSPN